VLTQYLDTISLIERLHRQFLDVVKAELDARDVRDINNVQALILFNIADKQVTVGELTARGYYLGSNVSYNLKKMVEHGYLEQARSPHDRRAVNVRMTQKGESLWADLSQMFERQAAKLATGSVTPQSLEGAQGALRGLERFWDRTRQDVTRDAERRQMAATMPAAD
jgi:DNA-binding MarR family transcriptional regulator